MKVCHTCRNQIDDKATICPFCGSQLQAPATGPAPPLGQAPQSPQINSPGPTPLGPQTQQQGRPPQQGLGAPPYPPQGHPQQGHPQQPGYGAPPYPPQQGQAQQGHPQHPGFGAPPYPQQGYPPYPPRYGQRPDEIGPFSPKKRSTVILLCFFLGWIGVHRFYLGKIVSGIFMILTLGGFGIWAFVDFLIAIFGTYKDSNGLYIERRI